MLSKSTQQLRLRVFAGPNGSGKSTIINAIQNTTVKGKKIDFGIYINADDIAKQLNLNKFSLKPYKLNATKQDIIDFAQQSGLLTATFNKTVLKNCFTISHQLLLLSTPKYYEEMAQLIARFLREAMLKNKQRFSFETVFSHPSNIDIMQRAAAQGYKVYLYFVSTENPEINKFRVQLRVKQKGHNVPPDKIESRYYRSLSLLYDAAETAYQCFFFDNTSDNTPYKLVNHFKKSKGKKVWDTKNQKNYTKWFKKYYWDKM